MDIYRSAKRIGPQHRPTARIRAIRLPRVTQYRRLRAYVLPQRTGPPRCTIVDDRGGAAVFTLQPVRLVRGSTLHRAAWRLARRLVRMRLPRLADAWSRLHPDRALSIPLDRTYFHSSGYQRAIRLSTPRLVPRRDRNWWVRRVFFCEGDVVIVLRNGRRFGRSIHNAFPFLKDATPEQRQNVQISPFSFDFADLDDGCDIEEWRRAVVNRLYRQPSRNKNSPPTRAVFE